MFYKGQRVLIKSIDVALDDMFVSLACRHDLTIERINGDDTVEIFFIARHGNKIVGKVQPDWIVPINEQLSGNNTAGHQRKQDI
jgi:hypothetical protein